MPSGLAAVKKVEYDSHSALVKSLQSQDALVISLNSAHGVRHQKNLIDATIEAGAKYIVPTNMLMTAIKSSQRRR